MMENSEIAPDRLIDALAAELRKPVSLDSRIDQRVMAEIRLTRVRTQRRRTMIWSGLGLAIAAGVAALAVFAGKSPMPGHAERVSFALEAPSANHVTLVGDFNNWDPQATPLRRVSSNGRWETTVPLRPGRYQFTFMIDGTRWVADPRLPRAVDDFGEPTSVITILPTARL
ncbi:MAG: isoamylase early set domain-containing protein [Gemmatimonadota bacterium]